MIPCVHDAASDMLALGSCLLDVCSFADVDGEVLLGPGEVDVSRHDDAVVVGLGVMMLCLFTVCQDAAS